MLFLCAFHAANLTSVTFGNGIKYIGSYAFIDCGSLYKIIVDDIGVWCGITFDYVTGTPFTYSTPSKYIQLYSDDTHIISDLIIPENVSIIKEYSFLVLLA